MAAVSRARIPGRAVITFRLPSMPVEIVGPGAPISPSLERTCRPAVPRSALNLSGALLWRARMMGYTGADEA